MNNHNHRKAPLAPPLAPHGTEPTPRQALVADALENGLAALQHAKDFSIILDDRVGVGKVFPLDAANALTRGRVPTLTGEFYGEGCGYDFTRPDGP